jgi:cytochrome b6-f complex iron-sulfur subunit
MNHMQDKMNRRSFLGYAAGLCASVMGIFAGVIGIGFLYPVKKKKSPALFICLVSQVPKNEPMEIKDPKGRKVLLLGNTKGELLAISTICTHLGCTAYYRPGKKRFECPCHGGVFDGEGNPIAGPPQRPLERYPVEIREGKVFVQFE